MQKALIAEQTIDHLNSLRRFLHLMHFPIFPVRFGITETKLIHLPTVFRTDPIRLFLLEDLKVINQESLRVRFFVERTGQSNSNAFFSLSHDFFFANDLRIVHKGTPSSRKRISRAPRKSAR